MLNNDCVDLNDLLKISERLNHVKDLDSLLDAILYEARKFCTADAGSIFLRNGNKLTFSYVQNETIAKTEKDYNKYIYNNFSVDINKDSIAGFVAKTGESVVLDNVYDIPDHLPFRFNSYFDTISEYHTQSVLAIPLVTSRGNITGVIQIINASDADGNITTFSDLERQYVEFLGNNASVAIERAQMTREIILRMIKMAELRDPKETGAHVNRVGSYAIEIYHRLADKRGVSKNEIRRYKDILRIAAMLHDVGKVAISDTILKKPARLDEDETKIMRTHCKQGANLFQGKMSDLDILASEIAISHHEKFDGSGYPRGLSGSEIPLPGRIVAIADVYDALICKRVYKEQWPEEEVLQYMTDQSGLHFDPEIIDAFMDVHEVIKAIRNRYPDE
ncbi:MAG: HD domain-containing phosphohydrolase [Spirochaetota bacterium]